MVKNGQTATARNPARRAGRLALLVYDQLHVFEYAIAVELFCLARPGLGMKWYDVELVAAQQRTVRGEGGISVRGNPDVRRLRRAQTIVIPGWRTLEQPPSPALCAELRRAHARGAKLFSICSGAYVLAYAGLLNGRRATTHWLYADDFRARFPSVQLDTAPLYIDDNRIITSAGSAAGIDAGLHLIRREFGVRVANLIARRMVVPPHRDGGQAQYIEAPVATVEASTISQALAWATARLHEPFTIAAWARASAMSPRSFFRHFVEATGTTPLRWLQHARLVRARSLLEAQTMSLDVVAEASGYRSLETFRAAFRANAGVAPAAYRARFANRRGAMSD